LTVIDLERFSLRLSHTTCKEACPNERSHGEFSYLSIGSMPPVRICKRQEIKRDTSDGGGTNADATLVGVVECAVKLIVATRLTRAHQELATWHPLGYE
jgi:hypothetical protein